MTSSELRQQVIQVLRTIYDPEMPVNIYELGLIYEVNVDETRFVSIRMTLTAPNCPVAGTAARGGSEGEGRPRCEWSQA